MAHLPGACWTGCYKVMASACLPQLFQAVEIDGDAYWDGGYMGNPALLPLIDETDAHDLIIIQVNPVKRDGIPRRAAEIMNRLNEITFNASLIKEIASILQLKELVDEEHIDRVSYTDMRLHLIGAENELQRLSVSSKMNVEWEFLQYLHDVGHAAADRWLAGNLQLVGKESTLDMSTFNFADDPKN